MATTSREYLSRRYLFALPRSAIPVLAMLVVPLDREHNAYADAPKDAQAVGHAASAVAARVVRVGCNVPLSGPLAVFGVSIQEGVEMARRERLAAAQGVGAVTRRGTHGGSVGVSPGGAEGAPGGETTEVEFIWDDNQSAPKQAVNVLRRHFLRSPDLYVSGVKPQAMAIKDEISQKGIPHFLWVFDVSVRPKGEPNNFRTWVNFGIEPPLFIDYAKRTAAKRVAIIYVQLPHTDEEYQEVVIPALKKIGVEDLLVESYQMDLNDFRSILLRVRSFAPDLMILSGFPLNLQSIVRGLRAHNMLKEGNAIASYDLLDAAPLLSPALVEGIRVSAPFFVTRKQEHPAIRDWYIKFESQYHKAPLYTHAYAYDMANIIYDAAGRLVFDNGQSALARTLRDVLQDTDLDGITGKLKFDAKGDLPAAIEIGVFRNGVPVPDR